jgi:pimeloyl-ACP methyl ester carboxylesterase
VASAARTLGVGAAVAGGAALGFLAERALVRRRFVPPVEVGPVPLGSLEGERTRVDGPDGVRVTIETYGPEDAAQVLLSHGWICTGRVWHEQVLALRDRARLVTYDQPGHGRTTSPSSGTYDLDLLGDTLLRVAEEACAPGPLVVVGHSMGGMAVLNAIRRSPTFRARVAGVVLISTTSSAKAERLSLEVGIRAVARLERGIRRLVPTLRDPRVVDVTDRLTASTSDLSYLAARWTSVGPGADPEAVAFTQQLALDSGSDVVLGLVEAVLGVDEDAALDLLADLPVSIVVGTHDRLTPAGLSRRMAERSGGRLVELPEVGHMAPLEAGDDIADVIAEHLDRAAAGGDAGRRPGRLREGA